MVQRQIQLLVSGKENRIISKLTEFFTRSSTRAPATSGMIVGRLYGNTLLPTGVLSATNAMTNSDIYATTALIASDISGMRFHSSDVIEQALNKPSSITPGFNFWQSVVAQMLLYGNAYVLINKNELVVTGFERLQDDQVQEVIVDDTGQALTYHVHFNDKRPDMYYDSSEILHFKLVSVGSDYNDQFFGKSPLISLVPELSINGLSNELAKSALQNGINPNIMIKVPEAQLDRGAKDTIRDGFVESTTGANFGKPIVLDASASVETLGIDNNVANLLDNLSFTKTQVSKAFGVPDSYLNGQGDQQSSIDMIAQMYDSSIQRYKNAIASELTLKLGTPVELAKEMTDDQAIARYLLLAENQVISSTDVNDLLKQKGIL